MKGAIFSIRDICGYRGYVVRITARGEQGAQQQRSTKEFFHDKDS
jgi:hypothetical protein